MDPRQNLHQYLATRTMLCTLYFVVNPIDPANDFFGTFGRARREFPNMNVVRVTEEAVLGLDVLFISKDFTFFVFDKFDRGNPAFVKVQSSAKVFGLPLIIQVLGNRDLLVFFDRPVFSTHFQGLNICLDDSMTLELRELLKFCVESMSGTARGVLENASHFVTNMIPIGLDWEEKIFWRAIEADVLVLHCRWIFNAFAQLRIDPHALIMQANFYLNIFEGLRFSSEFIGENERNDIQRMIELNDGELIDDVHGEFDLFLASRFTPEAVAVAHHHGKLIVASEWVRDSFGMMRFFPPRDYLFENFEHDEIFVGENQPIEPMEINDHDDFEEEAGNDSESEASDNFESESSNDFDEEVELDSESEASDDSEEDTEDDSEEEEQPEGIVLQGPILEAVAAAVRRGRGRPRGARARGGVLRGRVERSRLQMSREQMGGVQRSRIQRRANNLKRCNHPGCTYSSNRSYNLTQHKLETHGVGIVHLCNCGLVIKGIKRIRAHLKFARERAMEIQEFIERERENNEEVYEDYSFAHHGDLIKFPTTHAASYPQIQHAIPKVKIFIARHIEALKFNQERHQELMEEQVEETVSDEELHLV